MWFLDHSSISQTIFSINEFLKKEKTTGWPNEPRELTGIPGEVSPARQLKALLPV
jgi:hypothetical protein